MLSQNKWKMWRLMDTESTKPCPEQADRCWITRDPVTLLTGRASCWILPSINAPIRPGIIWAEETCDLRRKGRECHSNSSPLIILWSQNEESSIRLHAEFIFHFLRKMYILFNRLMLSSTVTNRYKHDILMFLASCFVGAKVTSSLLLLIPILSQPFHMQVVHFLLPFCEFCYSCEFGM